MHIRLMLLICISVTATRVTPGMLNGRICDLNIPTVFVSGGPMEAGRKGCNHQQLDLVFDAMIVSADYYMFPMSEVNTVVERACPRMWMSARVCSLQTQ